MAENKRKRPDLTEDERKSIISQLLERTETVDGAFRLARGAQNDVAKNFDINKSTVNRIWKRAQQSRADPNIEAYRASPQKKGRSGRPILYDREALCEAAAELPYHQRKTMRGLAGALGISVYTVWKLIRKEKVINPHSNAIKPFLTEENKVMRVAYAANEVEHLPTGGWKFCSGDDVVHLDEKWFFMTEQSLLTYLITGELPKKRTAKHKQHIVKVMFLAATARPRFDEEGNCTFDGKIGCWPFVKRVRARCASKNRPASTIETKCINVDAKAYKKMIFEKVIPAVKAKFPRSANRPTTVRFQQDNAPSHFGPADDDWVTMCFNHRWNANGHRWIFELKEQPANSPDTNILDLGFFRALQSLQFSKQPATTIDGLIANVMAAWNEYEPRKINYVFLTHQTCMEEIILANGDNNYSIPHMGKESLERHGALPRRIKLSVAAKLVLEELALLP